MYERAMGEDWDKLPQVVRLIHSPGIVLGTFTIRRGKSWLSRLVATVSGFPPAGSNIAMKMHVESDGRRLIWRRRFGAHCITTWQDQHEGIIREGRGGFYVTFRPIVVHGGLDHVQVSAGLKIGPLCVRLPRWLQPRASGRTRATNGHAEVCVEVHAPFCGLVLCYEGTAWPEKGDR